MDDGHRVESGDRSRDIKTERMWEEDMIRCGRGKERERAIEGEGVTERERKGERERDVKRESDREKS